MNLLEVFLGMLFYRCKCRCQRSFKRLCPESLADGKLMECTLINELVAWCTHNERNNALVVKCAEPQICFI